MPAGRDLDKLERELEESKIAIEFGPRLGQEMMLTGIKNSIRDIKAAAQPLVDSGRAEEAAQLIETYRADGSGETDDVWNEILDRVLGELNPLAASTAAPAASAVEGPIRSTSGETPPPAQPDRRPSSSNVGAVAPRNSTAASRTASRQLTPKQWARLISVISAGILLLVPSEAAPPGGFLLGIGLLAYAAYMYSGRPYLWWDLFYLAPLSVLVLLFTGGSGVDSERVLGGSTTAAGIGWDTTCAEYLGYSNDARGVAVRTLGVQAGWSDAGNPLNLFSFDSHCSQRPSQTMRQAIGLFAGDESSGQALAATATSAATDNPPSTLTTDPPSAAFQDGSVVLITNRALGSGRLVEVGGDAVRIGDAATGGPSQRWRLERSDGYYRFVNEATGRALDTYGDTYELFGAEPGDFSGQFWRLSETSGGFVRLTNMFLEDQGLYLSMTSEGRLLMAADTSERAEWGLLLVRESG